MYCKLIQWRLSCLLDTGARPTGRLLYHLQTCPRCRKHYLHMCRIHHLLLTQDPAEADRNTATLCGKIIAALPKNIAPPAAFAGRKRLPIRMTAAGLAAAILLAAALWQLRPVPAPPTYDDWIRLSRLMNAKIDSVGGRFINPSLEKEWDNVAQDVRKTVRFLAGCLPDAGQNLSHTPD